MSVKILSLNLVKTKSCVRCPICNTLLYYFILTRKTGNMAWYECYKCLFTTEPYTIDKTHSLQKVNR